MPCLVFILGYPLQLANKLLELMCQISVNGNTVIEKVLHVTLKGLAYSSQNPICCIHFENIPSQNFLYAFKWKL